MLLLVRCPPTISLLFLLLVASFQSSSSASDTLRAGDTLTGDATLVSANGMFEFGFFRTANSTYLGIWYHDITPRVVVWVANRDEPFANTSGQIKLYNGNNLVVLYGGSNTAWSTELDPSWEGNYTAKLGDDGNLVIQEEDADGDEAKRWQSFDFPTDTLLSGMKLYFDKTTGNGRWFRSWRTETDPAAGNYTLRLDDRGAAQLVMRDGAGRIRWRTGLWSGTFFNGVDRMRPLYDRGFNLIRNGDGDRIEFRFTYVNNTRMRFVLLPNGTETTYVYNNDRWNNIWRQPETECDLYNHCGGNAVCDESSERRCTCLFGFEPRSSSEWAGGIWTGGCERRTALKGQREEGDGEGGGGEEEEDGFKKMEKMKLPDEAEWDSLATDENGCEANCAGNGSCTAYAYLATGGCFRWTRELVDMFKFADGSNGESLYFRLAGSEFDKKNNVNLAVVIASVAAGTLLLLISILFCWKYKYRIRGMRKTGGRVDNVVTETVKSGEQHEIAIAVSEADNIHSDRKPFELPMFSFKLVEAATENFNEANELGRGGFGNVYKGKLPLGEEIAVKRLSRNSGQGDEEFKNEMTLIAKLQHVNLVRLLGCCIRTEEKMLIYEYMPNKSLDAFIFDPERQPLLDWRARFNIIEGVARGLLYLHRDSRLRIVHRDLKASNILLDQHMNPKISDFGMARIFGSNQNLESTNHVVGTFGYMSPEYAMEGLFSTKSDVYSFGVIVLEIVTGVKNTRCRSEEYHNLLGYAWKMWEEGQGMELVDPSMRDSCNRGEVLRCIHVALLCVQDHVDDRPTMSTVVMTLGRETENFPRPTRPVFAVSRRGTPETMATTSFSVNNLTITSLNSR